MSIDSVVGMAIAAAGAAIWTVRLGTLYRRRPATEPIADHAADVSIIVPARNEAHNLPALLHSLARLQPAPNEIIVVDDHSSDGTADVARAAGARVVTPPPLPEGWLGKPWACRTGADAARGRFLLFTDADTVHAPDSLGRATARQSACGAGLLSVVPTHRSKRLWERMQGVFQLLLLIACRAGGRRRRRGERRFSIGQYLLFDRETYRAVGGHHAVRDRVAEDLAMARMVEERGHRFELLFSPGLMMVRMYPEGIGGFVRGWRRNFREGMASAGLGGIVEITAVLGWLLGVPLWALTAGLAGDLPRLALWAGVYLTTAIEIGRRQRALGELRWPGALGYPLFALLFVGVSVLALLDRLRRSPVHWKQRSLTMETR